MSTSLFALSDISFSIAGKPILQPLFLNLEQGRVVGLIGRNGSGKSTLLNILARHVAPTGGTACLLGKPLSAWSDRDYARNVAYMPQFTPSTDGMNVRELVTLGRFPWHGTLGRFSREDAAMVDDAIDRTGLRDFAGRTVDTLSGGERQRVWLALMLAQNPRCMLLDEPTSALDIAHEDEVLSLVRNLAHDRGISVVVVLHDINLAARYCDDIIALRDGHLIERGTPVEVMIPETLAGIYGVRMGIFKHPIRGEPVSYVL